MVMPSAAPVPQEFRGHWGWFVGLGVLMIIAGVIALGSVLMATVVSVLVVGIMMIASGIVEIVHGMRMKGWGQFFLWVLIGILYVVAGLFAFQNPLLAAGALTLVLGVSLLFAGVARIFLAMQMRSTSPWGWVLASGIITLLLGALILIRWPVSSLYVLGIFLGVDLVIAGAAWLSAGLAFKRAA